MLTLHRPSNVDDRDNLGGIVSALEQISNRLPIVFPVHPRTRKTLSDFGLLDRLNNAGNIRTIEPLGYLDFLRLFSGARLVLTDSGGIQEETTVLGIPCLTLRENTERPITIEMGTNKLVGRDPKQIVAAAVEILEGPALKTHQIPPLWDGHTADRIISSLLEMSAPYR